MLEHLFEKVFKKERIFNDLLMKICETEIRHEFLEKAHLLVKSTRETKSAIKTPRSRKRTLEDVSLSP